MQSIESPSTRNLGVTLDSAPPRPPNALSPVAPQDSGGFGELARSPQLMAMQGMAMVKDGFQLLSNGIPELAQILSTSIMELEQMVTQAMTQSMLGSQMPQPPLNPGVAPMMSPPPGPGMGQGGPPQMGMPPRPNQM